LKVGDHHIAHSNTNRLSYGKRCAIGVIRVRAAAPLEDAVGVAADQDIRVGIDFYRRAAGAVTRAGGELVKASARRGAAGAVSKVKSVTVAGGGEGESYCDGITAGCGRGHARCAIGHSSTDIAGESRRWPTGWNHDSDNRTRGESRVRTAKVEAETVATAARHREGRVHLHVTSAACICERGRGGELGGFAGGGGQERGAIKI